MLRGIVLASIAVGAVLGVFALVVGELGDTESRIVVTSFLITGAALVSMPSVAAWERDHLGVLPLLGVAATVVGFAWAIAGVWVEYESETLWKIPTTLIIFGVATAGVALLQFARLSPRQGWLVTAATVAIGAVALMVTVAIWGEIGSDGYWRAFGAVAIVMTALLAAIPVLHRSQPASTRSTAFCPACGSECRALEGVQMTCPACGSGYVVDLR